MNILRTTFYNFVCIALMACGPSKKTPRYSGEVLTLLDSVPGIIDSVETVAAFTPIQTRYAKYLNVEPGTIQNMELYHFIEKWLKTPYKWGGSDERGIDCSAFIQRLYADVYSIKIPRTSIQQFFTEDVEKFKLSEYLTEGDLVFFRTTEHRMISHVGLYLHNGMFVNSSCAKGVSIASLKDPYWKKRYVAAGRINISKNIKP